VAPIGPFAARRPRNPDPAGHGRRRHALDEHAAPGKIFNKTGVTRQAELVRLLQK
jgi:hypothetical protein